MRDWLTCLVYGHDWKFQFKADVYEPGYSKLPIYEKHSYVCARCLKSKKVKL